MSELVGQNWHKARELTDDEKKKFLAYVEKHRGDPQFSVRHAADAAGVHRRDVRLTRKNQEDFDEDYRNARGYGHETVMDSMVELGIVGVEEIVVSAGKIVMGEDGKPLRKRVKDPRVAIELFKALTPDGKAALAGKLGILEINTGGAPLVEVQKGVTFDEVARVLRAAGKMPELEAPEGTAEVVDERDEQL